ncbi:uncharacterized protein YecA (UPF0149 family) [Natronobacillus azotifigens]|uniref:SEC-C metal-binding domain-containing protein n=1 Tax=Natronobacillus azotifigens TaxID=472978 RepID=A0A9J6R8J0_9BACI|nr:SEC-C metal-binding domain-containing protein [Natronobacillus azotifigens]MCZ0701627.1 SEC-C metal-binding domain-containing protein [Natronobacillus azotifigens]
MSRNSLTITDQQLSKELLHILDNTRMWKLKGNTPSELREKEMTHAQLLRDTAYSNTEKSQKILEPNKNIQKKIGRNHPCPCGSEKKYKRCCGY